MFDSVISACIRSSKNIKSDEELLHFLVYLTEPENPIDRDFLLPIENKLLKFKMRFAWIRLKNHPADDFLLVACFILSKILV
jgi:hypothetical protein